MSFVENLREQIKTYHYTDSKRALLKLFLGQLQQKPETTDEDGHSIVKKMIESNNVVLEKLSVDDERRSKYLEENEWWHTFLPQYLNADQIRESLTSAGVDVLSGKDGQVIGVAMGHFKKLKIDVDGKLVRQVVEEMRKSI